MSVDQFLRMVLPAPLSMPCKQMCRELGSTSYRRRRERHRRQQRRPRGDPELGLIRQRKGATMSSSKSDGSTDKGKKERLTVHFLAPLPEGIALPLELEPLCQKLEGSEVLQDAGAKVMRQNQPWCDLVYEPDDRMSFGGIEVNAESSRRRAGIARIKGTLRLGCYDPSDKKGLLGSLSDEDAMVRVVETLFVQGIKMARNVFDESGGRRAGVAALKGPTVKGSTEAERGR